MLPEDTMLANVARSGGTNSSTNKFTFSMKLSRGVTSTSAQRSKAKFDRLHHSLWSLKTIFAAQILRFRDVNCCRHEIHPENAKSV